MITFHWGMPYAEFFAEAIKLIKPHWLEVGSHRHVLSLNPDHARYMALEKAGMLHILTVRDSGKLVGYFFLTVMRHPRDQTWTLGNDELVYISPEYRESGVGLDMYREALKRLDDLQTNMAFFREKARRKGGGFLRWFGFEPVETVSAKILRAPGGAND